MNIVHISTYDVTGGAARAMHRLHQGLRAIQQDSTMLVRTREGSDPDSWQAENERSARRRKTDRDLKLVNRYYLRAQRTPVSNTGFSIPSPACDLSRHPLVANADVVHLHWIVKFLGPAGIARLATLGKPVVWTLHDQRAFTGGCHFSAGCKGYEQDCPACPQLQQDPAGLTQAVLRDTIAEIPADRITVICPSKWLAGCARRSALFKRSRIEVIPYSVDTACYRPLDKAEARTALGIDPSAVCFVFGAFNLREKRKGFSLLCDAIHMAMQDPIFRRDVEAGRKQFISFGGVGPEIELLRAPVHHVGWVDSEEKLARVYAAGDALLFSSTEDNLPNVLLEAMCCGTPAIAFDVGGVPDIITDGVNGLLIPVADAGRFAEALQRVAREAALRNRLADGCRGEIPGRFALTTQARSCLHLYETLLRDGRAQRVATDSVTNSLCPETTVGPMLEKLFPALVTQAKRNRRRQFVSRLRNGLVGWALRKDATSGGFENAGSC